MATMTGGQALVQTLKAEGVDTIFGLPGIQLDWAFDALHAEREAIRVVHTRHEQAAGYMADGFARTTGRPGVFLVVPGPGVLNTTASLATAYACNAPVLCLTGQINADLIGIGRGVLHEIDDQVGLLRHVTKWAARALAPAQIPDLVHEAFRQMRSGRPRPVALEIPPDVLQATADVEIGPPADGIRVAGDPERLERAAAALGRAERPLILSGGGVLAAGAWEGLRTLAEALEAPVVLSDNGRGALSERHYLAQNQLSLADLLPSADVILAIGTRLLDISRLPIRLGTGQTLIRVDADATQLGRGTLPTIGITGDADLALTELTNRVGRHNRRRPSRRGELEAIKATLRAELDRSDPQAGYGRALRSALPDDAIIVSESTQVGYFATVGLPIYEPRTYLTSGYQGTLGYGFPTALGAQVGNPGRRVVSLNGDGGFMFNVQELATAAQHYIPLITIVFDDGAFGNVRRIQEHSFGGRTIASDLRNPPFARLAELFGVAGVRAENADGLLGALREALAHRGPTLIEVPVGPMPMFLREIRERLAARLTAATR